MGGLGGIEPDQITRERPGPVQVGPRRGGAWGLAGERREALPGGTPRDAAGRGGARDGLLGWRLLRPEQKPAFNGFLP